MTPQRSYIICTSPRSGSTLLSSTLWQTGIAGKPAEYFNSSLLDEFRCSQKIGAASESEYMEKMITASTTPNGVFGTKLHAFQTSFLLQKISQHKKKLFDSLYKALDSELPHVQYVFLTRRNKIAQAVSYYKAVMTGEWWRWDGEAPKSYAHIPYDSFAIGRCLRLLETSDAYWEEYFTFNNLKPLPLYFEEILEDREGSTKKILNFLSLPTNVVLPAPATQKISDGQSLLWEKKFLEVTTADTESMPAQIKGWWAPY